MRHIIEQRVSAVVTPAAGPLAAQTLTPGKMLRTRAAARVLSCNASSGADVAAVERACAAVEMVHTASLCHDDVIDNAMLRRWQPSLWKSAGPTGAILIGDLLFASALELMAEGGADGVGALAAKVREVVSAEAEEELILLGETADEDTCLRLARCKTGPLFAFTMRSAGGKDAALRAALEEAGYRIGAAYQLADDLLDVFGGPTSAGKSLGTDALRGKPTLLDAVPLGAEAARGRILQLARSASDVLGAWPKAGQGVKEFLALDLQPVFDQCVPGVRVTAEPHDGRC